MDASATAFMDGVLQYLASEVVNKAVEEAEDKTYIRPRAIRAALLRVRPKFETHVAFPRSGSGRCTCA